MAEIEIELAQAEPVEVVQKTVEPRKRWKLRRIEFDPESRLIVVTFFSAINGTVLHKTRSLSVQLDSETGVEAGFWLDNVQQIKALLGKVLAALQINEVR